MHIFVQRGQILNFERKVIRGLNQTPKARYKNKTKFSSSTFHSKGLEKVFSEGKQSRWD